VSRATGVDINGPPFRSAGIAGIGLWASRLPPASTRGQPNLWLPQERHQLGDPLELLALGRQVCAMGMSTPRRISSFMTRNVWSVCDSGNSRQGMSR
jgi:hypothetical protein